MLLSENLLEVSKHFFSDLDFPEFVKSISHPIITFHIQNNLGNINSTVCLCTSLKTHLMIALSLSPCINIRFPQCCEVNSNFSFSFFIWIVILYAVILCSLNYCISSIKNLFNLILEKSNLRPLLILTELFCAFLFPL